jgi:hypothetical protein
MKYMIVVEGLLQAGALRLTSSPLGGTGQEIVRA